MRRAWIAAASAALITTVVASPAAARSEWAPVAHRTPAAKRTLTSLRALETQVLAEVNALRRERRLQTLHLSPSLSRAAAFHSRDMGRRGYFSHASANGAEFWRRVERFYGSNGFRHWSVGENLLWSSPDVDSARALSMWMASPPHRANLLSSKWREVGLAAVHVDSAPGVFGGHEITIVTANFGSRTR